MNILFTLSLADGYHGSVIYVYELSCYLSKLGHSCTVVCCNYSSNIKNLFNDKNINLIMLDDIDFNIHYDILWGIHFPIVSFLIYKNIKCTKLILNSLSPSEGIEMFPIYNDAASMLLSCSKRCKDSHIKNFGILGKNIKVFENFIPDNFLNFQIKKLNKFPKKIAVISNHIPDELLKLEEFLPDSKITFYGLQTSKYTLITPEILSNFDVIISIGKSVFYALGMGIPVYEYDCFGGNGYITPENIETELYHNFSGCNTYRKLDTKQISTEILNGYNNASKNRFKLKKYANKNFSLSKNTTKLLKDISYTKNFDYKNLNLCSYNLSIDLKTGFEFSKRLSDCHSIINNQTEIINIKDKTIYDLKKSIEEIKNSTSWKITSPLRKIKTLIFY